MVILNRQKNQGNEVFLDDGVIPTTGESVSTNEVKGLQVSKAVRCIFFYKNDGRKLKQIIIGLLKSGAATEIKRINYTQSYTLHDNKIQKTEEKVILVQFSPDNQKKLEAMLKKSDIKEYKLIKN